MLIFYARRLAPVATLLLLGRLITSFAPSLSDNVLVDIVVYGAILTAIAIPLWVAVDDLEHRRPLFGGRFSRH